MLNFLLQNPDILILALVSVIFFLLYLREYDLRKKLQQEGEKTLESFQEKGLDLLHQSMKKSQAILGSAELAGVKVVADSKFETAKLEEQYSAKLAEAIKQSQQSITGAQNQLLQFIGDLQKRSREFEAANQKIGQDRINQLFDRLEQRLTDFLIQTEQKTTSAIDLELKSARQLIETYKNQQFSLIDENIVAMMEQTLNIVLAKKLSLKDQLDLIYEALEKAKVEKFVI